MMLLRQLVLVLVLVLVLALPLVANAQQSWNYPFNGPDAELVKLWPVPPVGFPNADFIQNRTIDQAIAEYKIPLGRRNEAFGNEQSSAAMFSYGGTRENDMVILHKDQFHLDATHPTLRLRTAWSPHETVRTVAAGSQNGTNFIGQIGVMNTYDFTNETDAAPGISNPPANVQDDLWFADRDQLRDGSPNPFQRKGLTDRDSFWLGFAERSAIAAVSHGGYAGRGTTTVDIGLHNESGQLATLATGVTLDAYYSDGQVDAVYWYNVDFLMTFDAAAGTLDYDIRIDKYLTETGSSATETFIGVVGSYAGTVTPDLTPTPQQILHPALGYDIADHANISNEQTLYDFGMPASNLPNLPSVALATTAPAIVNGPFTVTATFSQPVTGFETADLQIGNGAASALSGSGASYSFDVAPDSGGNVTVAVPANVATSTLGGQNEASNVLTVFYAAPSGSGDELAPNAHTVALWHFNGNYDDASPNGFHLAPSGGVQRASDNLFWMANPGGEVARFSALGDQLAVTLPDAAVLPGSGIPLTIEARLFPRAYLAYSTGNFHILSLHQEWNAHFVLEDTQWGNHPKGPVLLSSNAATPLLDAQQWADAVTPNSWHRLVIRYDGSNTVSVCIDDIEIGSAPLPPDTGRNEDWTFTIGNFDGDIDEVAIHHAPIPGTLAALGEAVLGAPVSDPGDLLLDHDGDEWTTLHEIAFGSDPLGAESPAIHTLRDGDGQLVVVFPVLDHGANTATGYAHAALRYTVQTSADLADWESDAVARTTLPAGLLPAPDGLHHVAFTTSAAARVFVRILVEGL